MTHSIQHNDPTVPFGLDMSRTRGLTVDTDHEMVFLVDDDTLTSGWSDEIVFDDAHALYNADAFAAAETALVRFLKCRPKSVFAHDARFLLGMSLFRQDAFQTARVVFSEIVESYPESRFRSLADFYRRRCKYRIKSMVARRRAATGSCPVPRRETVSADPAGIS